MLHDWYHPSYFEVLKRIFVVPANPLKANNNLINKKMYFNCSALTVNSSCTPNASISKFSFISGKIHRLRLSNSGLEGTQRFSIDGHKLTVFAIDFVPIVPYVTDVVSIGVGQRTDVLVEGTGGVDEAYWMRSNFSQSCSSSPSLQPYALAVIYYPQADKSLSPTSDAITYTETTCLNDPLDKTIPYIQARPSKVPQITKTIDISYIYNASGVFLFTFGGTSFRVNFNNPILLAANNKSNTPRSQYPPQLNVHDFGRNTSIRLIITNSIAVSHPMHLHGHNFWILAQGHGSWNGTITNPSNPTRRDTFIIAAKNSDGPAYTVIEFVADNPGVWPFHCHIAGHASTGLYLNILERPDLVAKFQIPKGLPEACMEWDNWSARHTIDQIDAGGG